MHDAAALASDFGRPARRSAERDAGTRLRPLSVFYPLVPATETVAPHLLPEETSSETEGL